MQSEDQIEFVGSLKSRKKRNLAKENTRGHFHYTLDTDIDYKTIIL